MTQGRRRFGPDRIALLPVMVFLFGSLPLAGSRPALNAIVLIPLACAVWVLRARVVVIDLGIEVCNGLRAHRVAWTDVEGFDVPSRRPVRLLRKDGRPLLMTALSRRNLRELLQLAS